MSDIVSDPVAATSPTGSPPTAPPLPHGHSTSHRRLETAKVDLLVRAVSEAGRHPDPAVAALVMRFYRDTPPEDLLGRDPMDVIGLVVSQRELAERRPPGTALVRALTPRVDSHGWASPHTVIQIITDDMPFLVDSVTAELSRQGRAVHLVVHPQFTVRRGAAGELEDVLGLDVAAARTTAFDLEPPEDAIVESWMCVEIDREPDPAALGQLEQDLQQVLRDVREAVEDWDPMRRKAAALAAELSETAPPGVDRGELADAAAFLRWLTADNFTFVGFREYDLVGEVGDEGLVGVPGTGLGILRADSGPSTAFAQLPPEARALAHEPRPLVLTKANRRATVHRDAYLDYVGVKRFAPDGKVTGERRFLGLFSSSAYTQPVTQIPVISHKIAEVVDRAGFRPDGHSYKDLLRVLETYPRDELFQIDTGSLFDVAMAVLYMQGRRQTRLFLRRDPYGRFVSALIYLPRDRYTTPVRLRIRRELAAAYGSEQIDYTARVSESTLAQLHFVVRLPSGGWVPDVDEAQLEARVVEAARAWEDEFADALVEQLGETRAALLLKKYAGAFQEGYKEDFDARVAVADVRALESIDGDQVALNLYRPVGAEPAEHRFKLYRLGDPVSLSTVLPVLSLMGAEVTDERPYEIEIADRRGWVYDFGLRIAPWAEQGTSGLKERFEDAFAAAWSGQAETDGFNALVVAAGLTWRQAMVLRAYGRYLRQTGSSFSQDYIESALVNNVDITRDLVRLFEVRFDPGFGGERSLVCEQLTRDIEASLENVASLDQDRILRSFLALILGTRRTNAYQRSRDGQLRPYVSFKLDPHEIPELPKPLPLWEIWVYGPRVEGVHLRFARVARGGLRWSDRREDFRTEILGLVKAQTVKNAVIVPGGAKGGFVAKAAPDPAQDRDGWLAEGVQCYRTFISGMLDITDNLVAGEVVRPPQVVCHDGDDPYLVVAADKGTAKFSDIANEVAADYGFWLGDAFASGGSAGYDHKAMGITARGAWESVKRHFRELGIDVQTQDFTAVGIGDMSGDVFGNGMLRSEHIRLIAAFDHRHVFLDPEPVAARAYAERRRLFELPRSSWADYDADLISEGGGVFPRTAKSIPVSAQVRAALGLASDVVKLTPAELIRAVLRAPVDLLWNGGIGTYVKSGRETNVDVGDKGNDAIRVDGADLRVRVVGEGGNLGFTQLGRIEAALSGVRLNTDAIDNSAGVDTSDHEVNIKVLLDQVVRSGDLTPSDRNELLGDMTDEIAALVLNDNYEQNVALGNARQQAAAMISVHQRMIRTLEAGGVLDRALEFLPTDAEIEARKAAGRGLTSPELAVLLAYSKITATSDLLATGVAHEPYYQQALHTYFPQVLRERFADRLEAHPLREEIITCVVVNDMVNRGGTTYVFRAMEETGAGPAEVLRAYTVAREVFALPDLWSRVCALDGVVPTAAQTAILLEARRLLDRATRWMLQSRGGTVDVEAEIERFRDDIAALAPVVPSLLRGSEQERLAKRSAELVALGAPEDLALEAGSLLDVFGMLDCVDVARATGSSAREVAELYFTLSERYEVDKMLARITGLPRGDRWTALARAALRSDLYAALVGLTRRVIEMVPDEHDPLARTLAWEDRQAEGLARARATLDEIAGQDSFDLATLSVALRTVRTLVSQGA